MSTGAFNPIGRTKQHGKKPNTNKLKTERYLQSYGSATRLVLPKDRTSRLHIRRSSIVTTHENFIQPNSSRPRRTFSLLPPHMLRSTPVLPKAGSALKRQVKHRELSQAFRDAMLKPLTSSKSQRSSKSKAAHYKSEGIEVTGCKTTRTTFQSTKQEDSLLSLLEALEKVSL